MILSGTQLLQGIHQVYINIERQNLSTLIYTSPNQSPIQHITINQQNLFTFLHLQQITIIKHMSQYIYHPKILFILIDHKNLYTLLKKKYIFQIYQLLHTLLQNFISIQWDKKELILLLNHQFQIQLFPIEKECILFMEVIKNLMIYMEKRNQQNIIGLLAYMVIHKMMEMGVSIGLIIYLKDPSFKNKIQIISQQGLTLID